MTAILTCDPVSQILGRDIAGGSRLGSVTEIAVQ
jgi:hypothetical protein